MGECWKEAAGWSWRSKRAIRPKQVGTNSPEDTKALNPKDRIVELPR